MYLLLITRVSPQVSSRCEVQAPPYALQLHNDTFPDLHSFVFFFFLLNVFSSLFSIRHFHSTHSEAENQDTFLIKTDRSLSTSLADITMEKGSMRRVASYLYFSPSEVSIFVASSATTAVNNYTQVQLFP